MGTGSFKSAIENVAFQPPPKRHNLEIPDGAEEFELLGDCSKLPILIKRTATRNRPWLLVFHGSGEDAVSSFKNYGASLQEQLDVNLAMPEYPSYGRSRKNDDEIDEEATTEQGVYQMAVLACGFLTKTCEASEKDIIALGISIGGGVAAELASRGNVAAVILQSTFVSAVRVRFWTPWSCACDPFQTGDKMRNIASECRGILILHGERDALVNVCHAHVLAEKLQESEGTVQLRTFKQRGHGDMFRDKDYVGVVKDFVDRHTFTPGHAGAGMTMTSGWEDTTDIRLGSMGSSSGRKAE